MSFKFIHPLCVLAFMSVLMMPLLAIAQDSKVLVDEDSSSHCKGFPGQLDDAIFERFKRQCRFFRYNEYGMQISEWTYPDETIRTKTEDGTSLSEMIHLHVGDDDIEMPNSFGWFSKSEILEVNNRPLLKQASTAFNFWMPSGRYVEIPWTGLTSLRIREPGRPSPTASEYVVKIEHYFPICDRTDKYLSFFPVEKAIENRNFDLKYWSLKIFGTKKVYEPIGDGHQPGPEIEVNSDKYSLLFHCQNNFITDYPVCQGDFHDKVRDVCMKMTLPIVKVDEIAKIYLQAEKIYNSWIVVRGESK